MTGILDRWAARRMLIAQHAHNACVVKSDDDLVVEAFLWRQVGHDGLAETLEDAREPRPTVVTGTVVKDYRHGLAVLIDDYGDDPYETGRDAVPFDPGDRVRIVVMADGHMVAVENVTSTEKYKRMVDGLT